MKNLLKSLLTILLGLMFVAVMSQVSLAADSSDDDDDDLFSNLNSQSSNSNDDDDDDDDDDDENVAELKVNNVTNNTSTNNTTNNTTNTTNNTSNTNRSVTNTNTLAKTGLADQSGVVLVILVAGISAIYSFKKVNDYKKI